MPIITRSPFCCLFALCALLSVAGCAEETAASPMGQTAAATGAPAPISVCPNAVATCGNGVIDPGEACDQGDGVTLDFGGKTCASELPGTAGGLTCTCCALDTSGCMAATAGPTPGPTPGPTQDPAAPGPTQDPAPSPAQKTPCEKLAEELPPPAAGLLGMCTAEVVELPCREDQATYLCDANPSTDPESLNLCRNEADCAVMQQVTMLSDAMMGPTMSNIARECGLPYLAAESCEAIHEGAGECIIEETTEVMAPGVSPECAGCYTESLLCNLRCLQDCSGNAESAGCIACQHAVGCRGLFYKCSGLEPMN